MHRYPVAILLTIAIPAAAATCESLASLSLPDSTITMAQSVPAGGFTGLNTFEGADHRVARCGRQGGPDAPGVRVTARLPNTRAAAASTSLGTSLAWRDKELSPISQWCLEPLFDQRRLRVKLATSMRFLVL
jgi:hypothetical protein